MKRLIMATMVTAILASSTVWAADNAPVAAQQQTQQVQQTQKTAAAERISEQGLYAMRDVFIRRSRFLGFLLTLPTHALLRSVVLGGFTL